MRYFPGIFVWILWRRKEHFNGELDNLQFMIPTLIKRFLIWGQKRWFSLTERKKINRSFYVKKGLTNTCKTNTHAETCIYYIKNITLYVLVCEICPMLLFNKIAMHTQCNLVYLLVQFVLTSNRGWLKISTIQIQN